MKTGEKYEETLDIMGYGEEGKVYDETSLETNGEMRLAYELQKMCIKQYNICAQKLIKEKENLQSLISNKWADVDDLKFT